jgi:hypothetical protein
MNKMRMIAVLFFSLGLSAVQLAAHGADASPALTGKIIAGDDELKDMLTGLGFEPKAIAKGFLVTIKQDTWTTYVQLVLSNDKTKIGMNANLGKVDQESVTASQWMALLAANADIDPSVFYYNKDAKKLYIHRVLDNRSITPAFLRDQIEKFDSNVRETKGLWSFTK